MGGAARPPRPSALAQASAAARALGRYVRGDLAEVWLPAPMPDGPHAARERALKGGYPWKASEVLSPTLARETLRRCVAAYVDSWRSEEDKYDVAAFLLREDAWAEERLEMRLFERVCEQRGLPPPRWYGPGHEPPPPPDFDAFMEAARRRAEGKREGAGGGGGEEEEGEGRGRAGEERLRASANAPAAPAAPGASASAGAGGSAGGDASSASGTSGATAFPSAAAQPFLRLASIPPETYRDTIKAFVEGYKEEMEKENDGEDDARLEGRGSAERAGEGSEGGKGSERSAARDRPREDGRAAEGGGGDAGRDGEGGAGRGAATDVPPPPPPPAFADEFSGLPVPLNYEAHFVPKRDAWEEWWRAARARAEGADDAAGGGAGTKGDAAR
eukprot:PRCOL_00007285-RA